MAIVIMILRASTTLIVGIVLWVAVDGAAFNLVWIVPLAILAGSVWVWILGPLAVKIDERRQR